MTYKVILILFVIVFFHFYINAQTVTWSTPPTYDSLEEYGTLYKIREHGKVGLADKTGKSIITAQYDSITPFYNYLALALMYESGKYAVKGIIDQQDFQISEVTGQYYITEKYPFFSEGKLVVYDASGKYGYMKPNGMLFQPCQYTKAYPFYEGLACIHKNKNEISYLKEDGNELRTELETEGYVLLTGTSFNEKGEAFVQGKAVGVQRCIINTSGKIVRDAKISGSGKIKNYVYRKAVAPALTINKNSVVPNADIQIITDGEKKGFSCNGHIILSAQLDDASLFKDGYAKVKIDGKYGILKLSDSSFAGRLEKDILTVRNGESETVKYIVSVPDEYAQSPISLRIINGKTDDMELSPTSVVGKERIYTFTPHPVKDQKEANYKFIIQTEGLLLWEDMQQITYDFIVSFPPFLSGPDIAEGFNIDEEGYVRANSNNAIEIYAVLENKSTEVLNTTVVVECEGKVITSKKVSITSYGKILIPSTILDIKERKAITVTVRTSDGVKLHKIFKVKPFI